MIKVFTCRESKFTWKAMITVQFGDMETTKFMPQVTGQSVVLEVGMDARDATENFGLKAGAMSEGTMTEMAQALEANNIMEASKYMWTPTYVYEGGEDFEADMTEKMREAKVQ